jgi:hypothetical protein
VLRESRARVARLPNIARAAHVARVRKRVDSRAAARAVGVAVHVRARRDGGGFTERAVGIFQCL